MHYSSPRTENFPVLIAQVDTPQAENTGDFYYRTYAPGIGMARCEAVYALSLTSVHRLKQDVMREAGVLIINNLCDADLLPVIRERKAAGKLTVYELCDDLDDIPPSNPIRGFYSQSKNLLLIKRLANYCDAVQFSSHELQGKFGYLNAVSAVFPNQMLEIPSERKENPSGMVSVGWGGSLGHFQDMKNIAGPLMEWIMKRGDVRLHLMCAAPIRALFDKLPPDKIFWSEPGSLQDYYGFVSQLDIGLAPLEDISFNRSRSDVKFLEYAANSVVPVVQSMGPYLMAVQHGKTGFLFNSTDELTVILDRLASDTTMRAKVAAAAHGYVLRERNQIDRGRDSVDFYRGLLADKGWKPGPGDGNAGEAFKQFSCSAGARKTGRSLLLGATRYEMLLTGGLLALQSDGLKALDMFQEAVLINPAPYMPYLFGASVCDDSIRSLFSAIQKNPFSITAWLCLGSAYCSRGMSTEAVDAFMTAARIFPEYEQPYIECAGYLNRIGMKQDGIDLMKRAIALIPEAIRNPRGEGSRTGR